MPSFYEKDYKKGVGGFPPPKPENIIQKNIRGAELILCSCGTYSQKRNLCNHLKSKRHQLLLQEATKQIFHSKN